jgi:erythromycin esterase-like protein
MLASELGTPENPAKLVVWAHDGHVGDARATSLHRHTLGQRMRERHPDAVALVGFTTYAGTLRLAESWDSPSVVAPLAPSAPESWEALFHDAGIPRFMITSSALRRAGEDVRLHRSVGATVRSEQYFEARLADHYDVIVHVDTTRAVDVVACADSTSMEFAGRSPRENHATQATLQAVPQAETGRARATADLKR